MNFPQQRPRGFLRRFFGGIGSVIFWLRRIIANIFFLFFLFFIIALIASSAPKPLPEKFALQISPSGILVDQRSYMDTASLLFKEDKEDPETLVRDLVDAINHAADDPRVTALVLEPGGLQGGGITKMEEIAQALLYFKSKQKPIMAVSDNYSQDQYYLASFADEIYMHPMGEIELTGYGRYITYYKTALEKLGVNVHVFRSGKYKDFIEPFVRDNMSDESREHNTQWLNALWSQYTSRVEEQRKLPEGTLNDFINHMDSHLAAVNGDAAQLALNAKLVDKLVSRHDMDNLLIDRFGKGNDDNFYNGVDAHNYLADINAHKTVKQDKVGLIVASGTIEDGRVPEGNIGSENFVELLRSAGEDHNIKALVIRVDSGGGSAFASEIIRAEIAALKAKKIPVVISMGSVAASGGYWMSTAGDEIWAMPTTITGSIGVFGAFPTLENSLQKIGLNTDGISTTELGGAPSLDRPLAPKMNGIIQSGVDHIYQTFLSLVAESRHKTVAEVHEIAQGHVWTGKKAQELGLVDHLGSLNDAITAAAARAQLAEYSVQVITPKLSPKEELIRKLAGEDAHLLIPAALRQSLSQLQTAQAQLGPLLKPLELVKSMKDPQGIYASCLSCIAP